MFNNGPTATPSSPVSLVTDSSSLSLLSSLLDSPLFHTCFFLLLRLVSVRVVFAAAFAISSRRFPLTWKCSPLSLPQNGTSLLASEMYLEERLPRKQPSRATKGSDICERNLEMSILTKMKRLLLLIRHAFPGGKMAYDAR